MFFKQVCLLERASGGRNNEHKTADWQRHNRTMLATWIIFTTLWVFCNGSNQTCPSADVCLTEECVMAASTVLSSMDRSVDPCENFYQFACGGWIKTLVTSNTNRFDVVDKRNQRNVEKMLTLKEETDADINHAKTKAKDFYKSCLNASEEHDNVNLMHLLELIDTVGGWHLTGNFQPDIDFDQRVRNLQLDVGVEVFFSWLVMEQEGQYRMALIPGGWNDAFSLADETPGGGGGPDQNSDYLKLMTKYTWLLHQAEEETVSLDLGDIVSPELDDNNTATVPLTIDIRYEYVNVTANEIQDTSLSSQQKKRKKNQDKSIILKALTNESDTNGHDPLDYVDKEESPDDYMFDEESILYSLGPEAYKLATFNESLSEVVQFEKELGNLTDWTPFERSSLTPFKIGQLAGEFPFLNWTAFFHSAFKSVGKELENVSSIEVLLQEDYFRSLNALVLKYFNQDRLSVLQNYMIWRVIAAFYLDRPSNVDDRKETCLKQTEEVFSPVVTAMYIRSTGIDKSAMAVQEVTMMVKAMQEAFRDNLNSIKWISPESAKAANDKLEHMADLIGYPTFVLNSTWLDLVYQELSIHPEHYLKNVANHRSFERAMELKNFFQSPMRGAWNEFSHMANIATVNAYYNQVTNTMVVPIGMLQPPLFWSRPKSLTFGAFGIVVAHEITHAFDEVGIKYNAEGAFEPLYDEKTIEAFLNASSCIQRQYSEFSIAGIKVDGNNTMGENIADHGGLKIAEIAYENWLKLNNGKDTRLPALDQFTPMQLFYLGYALPWCAAYSDNRMMHAMNNVHAPEIFRVRGPLSNSFKFAETWGCSPESSMNPPDKCHIWG